MSKYFRFIQNYLLYALPFVLVCAAWGTIQTQSEILNSASIISRAAWEMLSLNLMLWFFVLILFLVLLVAVPGARDKTLKRLANLKDRDEREEFITGKASRTAYVSTLSLLILLLFFSIFTLNIYRVPESEAINGKRGTVSISTNFSLWDKSHDETLSTKETLFEYKGMPLSKSAILLGLILWQLAIFNFTARKENALDF
jgi:hypothetical protein